MDAAERSAYQPIAEEAERRGYCVTITDDKFAKCEIGFYCQHMNHPQYSKFSVIMLHDIIQQYGNWPDIWYREPWNKYDIDLQMCFSFSVIHIFTYSAMNNYSITLRQESSPYTTPKLEPQSQDT